VTCCRDELLERQPGLQMASPHCWRLTAAARRRLGITWIHPRGPARNLNTGWHWAMYGWRHKWVQRLTRHRSQWWTTPPRVVLVDLAGQRSGDHCTTTKYHTSDANRGYSEGDYAPIIKPLNRMRGTGNRSAIMLRSKRTYTLLLTRWSAEIVTSCSQVQVHRSACSGLTPCDGMGAYPHPCRPLPTKQVLR
jgi:hypothetical protein